MNTEVMNEELNMDIYGFSGTAMNDDYVGTVFSLMDKMWRIIKSNNLKNKGRNIWVYEENDNVFAGVELDDAPPAELGLEKKAITLRKYGYYKHIGPYNLIRQAGLNMSDELKSNGFEISSPYIEIYGHWTEDENRLETELFVNLK